jgi:hypothetical protein
MWCRRHVPMAQCGVVVAERPADGGDLQALRHGLLQTYIHVGVLYLTAATRFHFSLHQALGKDGSVQSHQSIYPSQKKERRQFAKETTISSLIDN